MSLPRHDISQFLFHNRSPHDLMYEETALANRRVVRIFVANFTMMLGQLFVSYFVVLT
jgi:hypothetical protein